MKAKWFAQVIVGLALLWLGATAAQAAEAPGAAALGINLSGLNDWNTELPLADAFKLARPWVSQQSGTAYGKGPAMDLDAHGWVKHLEPGCWAETLLFTSAHPPAGTYTITYEGSGTLDVSHGAKVIERAPGKLTVTLTSPTGGFGLVLRQTDPKDYIRNIHVPLPGCESTYQTECFNPSFLKCWQGVACLRFMDWQVTNGSTQQTWAQRPHLDDASYAPSGAPVELMCALANRLQADAWFCLPHQADDEYVRQFATLVKAKLDPGRKVYVEYSNEVWNGQFLQARYANEQAVALGLGPKERPWEGGALFYAQRATQIFTIWEEVFGGHERLVRVLAWQAANSWAVARLMLPAAEVRQHVDALAIAPYLTLVVTPTSKPSQAEVEQWTVTQVLDYVAQTVLPQSLKWMQAYHELAAANHLQLLAYEGGQHLVGARGGENSKALQDRFLAANAQPRLGELYDQYFAGWQQAGGGLFCYFASTGRWSKWGSWGALQYADDDPLAAPKYMAIMKWAKACGQNVNVPAP